MQKEHLNTELDEIIRTSIKLEDEPSAELNNLLRENLYRRGAAMRKAPGVRSFSLWYLPMALNLVTFTMLAGATRMAISNTYLSLFAAGICFYIGLSGILLTMIGVRRTNIKEDITIHVRKRGALA